MDSNEELLRQGECAASNCIEAAGHDGPHSLDLQALPKQAQAAVERAEIFRKSFVEKLKEPMRSDFRPITEDILMLAAGWAKTLKTHQRTRELVTSEMQRLRYALVEDRAKLEAVAEVTKEAGCNLPLPSGERCGECGNCRTCAILGGGR